METSRSPNQEATSENASKDEAAASGVKTPQPGQFVHTSKRLDYQGTINPFALKIAKAREPMEGHTIPGSTPKDDAATYRVKGAQPSRLKHQAQLYHGISARSKRRCVNKDRHAESKKSPIAAARFDVDYKTHSEPRTVYELSLKEQKKHESVDSHDIRPAHVIPFLPYVEKITDGCISQHDLTSQPFNPVKEVKSWLRSCDELHQGCCGPQVQADVSGESGPRLLIDVVEHCLVRTPPAAKYVALSYVWGGSSASACATNENVGRLLFVRGLDHLGDIPRTVEDAMCFVRELGIQYLWCDRLCIVQDGGSETEAELNTMGRIYALSYFTLVAAQGNDASDELYVANALVDQNERDSPNDNTQDSLKMSSKQILLDQAELLMDTKWYSRAWTFQEYLFSKRRVIFQSNTVNWECLETAWHESQIISRPISRTNVASPVGKVDETGFRMSAWPDMTRYARLVSIFNQRQLVRKLKILDALLRQGLFVPRQLSLRLL
jgi:hypothetical protein